MKIVWDEPKRLANLDKHKLDFTDLIHFEWETALITTTHMKRLKAIGCYEDGTAVAIYAELERKLSRSLAFGLRAPGKGN